MSTDKKDQKIEISLGEIKAGKLLEIKGLLGRDDLECLKSQIMEILAFHKNRTQFLEFKGFTFTCNEITENPNDNIDVLNVYGDGNRKNICDNVRTCRNSLQNELSSVRKTIELIISSFADILNDCISKTNEFKDVYNLLGLARMTISKNEFIVQNFVQDQIFSESCMKIMTGESLKDIIKNIISFNNSKDKIEEIRKKISANISSLYPMFTENTLLYGFTCYNFDKQYTDFRKIITLITWGILSFVISYKFFFVEEELFTNAFGFIIYSAISYWINSGITKIAYNVQVDGCPWRYLNLLGFIPTYVINNQPRTTSLETIYEKIPAMRSDYIIKLLKCCCAKEKND